MHLSMTGSGWIDHGTQTVNDSAVLEYRSVTEVVASQNEAPFMDINKERVPSGKGFEWRLGQIGLEEG